ncbi:ankyrin repeat [Fusarium mexicanum]|uniref:Ankyrin repeat n=1 Tax=Fusarium mexicanum TaxID=751941 RepID=A0A8H5IJU5_9HYPO|nr:ankyrin repeat [Fusarium mexicanum]
MLPSPVHIFFLFLSAVRCAAADAGDDFSNNLFSDLAPLLALFGERVTMQFMSQSMGWADHFILAMAPLGIVTIIVSAIRVGGPSWLKAIIGRARENLAVAEADIMSSTSKEVCELWNGREVVRCMGSAPVSEFICILPDNTNFPKSVVEQEIETIELREAVVEGHLQDFDNSFWNSVKRKLGLEAGDEGREKAPKDNGLPASKIIVIRNTKTEAPNISLNSHNQLGRGELRLVAVIASILQFGVLTFCAFATYHPSMRYPKDDSAVKSYAFPCNATGTLTLILGLLVCSHVVESSTSEKSYKPGPGRKAFMVWLQSAQTVSDQHFRSYAVYPKSDRKLITTSQRAPRGEYLDLADDSTRKVNDEKPDTWLTLKTVFGTTISLCGFVVQFVGLRGMHWSASIAQLVAVLIMMGLKAWVRRGLAEPPGFTELTPGFELDWFSTTLGDIRNAPWSSGSDTNLDSSSKASRKWIVGTGGQAPDHNPLQETEPGNGHSEQGNSDFESNSQLPSPAHKIMKLRKKLGRLAGWQGPASEEAVAVARAIEITMNSLFQSRCSQLTWTLYASFGSSEEQPVPVNFRLKRQDNRNWKADSDDIEATLSLWLYSVDGLDKQNSESQIKQYTNDEHGDDGWLRATGPSMTKSLRLLGLCTQALAQSLKWWIPSETPAVFEDCPYGYMAEKMKEKMHRVVGCGVHQQFNTDKTTIDHPTINSEPEASVAQNIGSSSAKPVEDIQEWRVLVAESYSPLKLLYAQDIFSAFIWSMAKSLQGPLPGTAEIRPIDNDSNGGSWHSFTLWNNQLSKMVQEVQSTGLGSAGDIYFSIIPPLSMAYKLPQNLAVVELARQRAKHYEQLGYLGRASGIYFNLLRKAAIFSHKSAIYTKAAVVVLDCLRQLNYTIQLRKAEGDNATTLELYANVIKKEMRAMEEQKKTALLKIFSNLMKLYEAQDRGWECDLVPKSPPSEKSASDRKDESVRGKPDMLAGFDLMNISYLGLTGLHHLAHVRVRRLPEDGALEYSGKEINCKDIMGWAPIHYAIAQGVLNVVEQVLDNDQTDLNACDIQGWTALHHACLHANEEIVWMIIRQGAGVNIQGRDMMAPLHCAAMNGHLNLVSFLVEAGATVDVLDGFRMTPFHWAARNGHDDVVKVLRTRTSKDMRDYRWRTALHLAASTGKTKTVEELLGGNDAFDIEARDTFGRTPLHSAVNSGQEAVACLLLEKGADIGVSDYETMTLLHNAVAQGREGMGEMARLLLENKANIEARNRENWTPMHMAARRGMKHVVELLLKEGGDAEALDNDGRTPPYWSK